MPRRSQAALNLPSLRVYGRQTRLAPPRDLDAGERDRFVKLVSACAVDHFRESDAAVVTEYVRAAMLCERAAAAMREAGGAVVGTRINPWFGVWQRAVRTLAVLSTRLRLNPQGRMHQ